MKSFGILGCCLLVLLVSGCKSNTQSDTPSAKADTQPGALLFEDAMSGDWQDKWFLDGKRAILEHRQGGLYFEATPSGVDKRVDRATFDAHHAVLWTKQAFDGDIRITYEITKFSGTNLLYIQAQGIGVPPYETDIDAWRDLREVASMKLYHDHMNLLSLSFRENIRCKRYPWNDLERGIEFDDVLIEPMLDYDRMQTENPYRVVVEKRQESLKLSVQEIGNPDNHVEHTWDTSTNRSSQRPRFMNNGRIGLRHMGGTRAVYRNFKVQKL